MIHLCTAYCHKQRIIKLQNHFVIPFGFWKGKTDNLSYQFIAISNFFVTFLNTRERKKNQFTFIVDRGWRQSRLSSLARVLLCLVIVGVPQVFWAVMYLDKIIWRAVSD